MFDVILKAKATIINYKYLIVKNFVKTICDTRFWVKVVVIIGYLMLTILLIILSAYCVQTNPIDWNKYDNSAFEKNAFVWQDNFSDNSHFVVSDTKNLEIHNQKSILKFSSGKNTINSNCIDLSQVDTIQSLEINVHNIVDFETKLQLTDCDNKIIHTLPKIQEGKNLFDLSEVNLSTKKIKMRLDLNGLKKWGFLPSQQLKLDNWKIWTFSKSSIQATIQPISENVVSGQNIVFGINIKATNSNLPPSRLIIDMAKTNANITNPNRKASIVSAGADNQGKIPILPSDITTGQLIYNLSEIKVSQAIDIQIVLKTQDGFNPNENLALYTTLDFTPIINIKSDSGFVQPISSVKGYVIPSQKANVKAQSQPIQTKYDRYSNLSNQTDNIWTLFFLDDKNRDNNSIGHSDAKNLKLKLKLGEGSCKPVFKSTNISKLLDNDNFDQVTDNKQFNQFSFVKQPKTDKEVENNDSVIEVDIPYWSFENIYRGLVVFYDIKGSNSCQEGSTLKMVSELYQDNKLIQTEIVEHPIFKNSCVAQTSASRDVIRINQTTLKPDHNYWPEWRIGQEANCFNMTELRSTERSNPIGLVKAGEYFWTSYWANEGFRTNTITLDWLYILYPIPKGTSFHGTWTDLSNRNQGNFYPSRAYNADESSQKKQLDKQIQFYKGDLKNPKTIKPDNSYFDHKDPVNSGWYPIELNQVPLKPESDITKADNSVYYDSDKELAIIARAKNFEPAWKKDFFLPIFVMRLCDGNNSCNQLKDGVQLAVNTIESFALSDGECKSCGQSKFGTIQVGTKSFPKVNLESDKTETQNGSDLKLVMTPENHIFGSDAVDGKWQLDLTQSKNSINWESIKSNPSCVGCNLPAKCDLSQISWNQPSIDNPIITLDLSKTPECQPDRGFGKRNFDNLCKDGYNQNWSLNVSFKLKDNLKDNLKFQAKIEPTNAVDTKNWNQSNYQADLEIKVK